MPSADRILLDTHAVLWWKAGGDRLSDAAARRIETAEQIFVSPISCWEIAMLVGKGRVRLDRPVATWVSALMAERGIQPAPFTPRIAVSAADLPEFHGDPADRFLVATAMASRLPLVTKDDRIHGYAARREDVEAIW